MTALTGNGIAEALNDKLAGLDLAGRLALVAGLGGRAVFTTSLGIEDQVITAAIGTDRLAIDVVTLETGRLFKETVDLIDETEDQYGITITRYHPRQDDIDAALSEWCLSRGGDEIVETLWPVGVPVAKVMQPHRQTEIPQLAARGFFEDVAHPVNATVPHSTMPARFSGGPPR